MDMQDFLDHFQAYEAEIAQLKAKFVDFIKGDTRTLDERWEVFCRAPDSLKEHEVWVEDFPAYEALNGEIVWYDDFYCDRHQTMYTEEICQSIKEKEEDGDVKPGSYDVIREEVLQKNLMSFENDW